MLAGSGGDVAVARAINQAMRMGGRWVDQAIMRTMLAGGRSARAAAGGRVAWRPDDCCWVRGRAMGVQVRAGGAGRRATRAGARARAGRAVWAMRWVR